MVACDFTFDLTTMSVLVTLTSIILVMLSFKVYQKYTNVIYKSKKRLNGKTIIITGGTAGIGLEIAIDLAKRGAKIIIACPFEDEGTAARTQIVTVTGNENVSFKLLDLGSLESVRQFATHILRTEKRLDILINNAGVGIPCDLLTKDGMNFIMQVNYYGTFLLSLLLLPILKKTGTAEEPSRILTTTSVLHLIGKVDIVKANSVNYWYKVQLYANSKLYLIHFASELSKRLEGSNLIINNVDPGVVGTRIYDSINEIIGFILASLLTFFFRTPWEGAQTTIYATLDEGASKMSGVYFKNCKVTTAAKHAYDEEITMALWKDSVRLVRLTDSEMDQCFQGI